MRAPSCTGSNLTFPPLTPIPSCCRLPSSSSQFSHQISFTYQRPRHLGFGTTIGRSLYRVRFTHSKCVAIHSAKKRVVRSSASLSSSSQWEDDEPYHYYEVLPSGKRVYLDEQDVVTFLDPPKELIPLDPSSYNPAAYLWKKIKDVPEERRHRLLQFLQPRLISRAWGIAGSRYEDPKLSKKVASALLSDGGSAAPLLEFWNCRTSGGALPVSWIKFFKKAIFCCKDGMTCGRLLVGSFIGGLATSFRPLYFTVRQVNEVMSTEQPCDFAYDFGDGLFDIHEYPPDFPKPAKHPWPFNDQVIIYVRHLGPGVMVGQAWQEGEALDKVPQKLCGEILMVKDYSAFGGNE